MRVEMRLPLDGGFEHVSGKARTVIKGPPLC